ncbi:MAG: hypothetical protein LBT10_04920 [Methanobrevibacter sp.]|nr:hypothetical protein [Methanobrevibacter sp.]
MFRLLISYLQDNSNLKKGRCIPPIAYNNDAYNCSLIVSLVILSLALNYMDTYS